MDEDWGEPGPDFDVYLANKARLPEKPTAEPPKGLEWRQNRPRAGHHHSRHLQPQPCSYHPTILQKPGKTKNKEPISGTESK
ncbi:hypothetical protein DSO57_1011325 [Entomophthora muscae]|uniref:Uncharacterized protein n=1 Tax=Entomophthora muscae TaxID=34485 RepID=A0ACC2T6S0_9FUNG|nr:hypothetical protein DSO57_1011325 [Entomophthora muscae]